MFSNSKQLKVMTITLHLYNSFIWFLPEGSMRYHWVHFIKWLIIVLLGTRRKGAPFMTHALRKDSFNFNFMLYTLLSDFSNVWDLPVFWSEITSITMELRNAPSTAADLFFNSLHWFIHFISFSFHFINSIHYAFQLNKERTIETQF